MSAALWLVALSALAALILCYAIAVNLRQLRDSVERAAYQVGRVADAVRDSDR